MGRPSRPIDPEAGSIQAFAEELRSLRALAGSPTYQTMANRSGRSKEALADAARGVRMVSWETVDAYVVACGGDPAEWKAKYLKAHPARVTSTPPADGPEHPLDEPASREQGLPVNGVGAETVESRGPNWPMPRRWVRGSAIAGGIAALAIAGIHGLRSSSPEPEGALMLRPTRCPRRRSPFRSTNATTGGRCLANPTWAGTTGPAFTGMPTPRPPGGPVPRCEISGRHRITSRSTSRGRACRPQVAPTLRSGTCPCRPEQCRRGRYGRWWDRSSSTQALISAPGPRSGRW